MTMQRLWALAVLLTAPLLCLSLTSSTLGLKRWSDDEHPFDTVTIAALDGSIRSRHLSLGATTINMWVPDKYGQLRDLVAGYDNLTMYLNGTRYFGPVVGRYANRIKNGTFSIPPTRYTPTNGPNVYHIPTNENNGADTLHGGTDGFDHRTWVIDAHTSNSVTYSYVDPDGREGFPGTVTTYVTYTLHNRSTWSIKMSASANSKTPILLSSHDYWNFDAWNESTSILDYNLQLSGSRVIETDGILVPTGGLQDVSGTAYDFRTARTIGSMFNDTVGFCGTGCQGYDTCWIYDELPSTEPRMSVWSSNSGIRLDIWSNQPAAQVYTCNGIQTANVTMPRKADQGGPGEIYENHSCMVIEQEGWIDAINNPQWGQDQIYGPERDYLWTSTYRFSIQQ
ncbi:galactose mutarotase-like protein [Calocera viscosa TUFC12733]|uniref:Galactose mutarotase-like protein n=1 Tax=Calocera viscosa (strain TUFC12733) TaxID=1330018 RepID=A0A167QK56_CALVF|nr:galactose mutarotase-like protein [Calocera viscosa TUFC12733]